QKLRSAQGQLVQAGKMAAVGTLVAGLSHELNNPLGMILGFAQALQDDDVDAESTKEALSAIERQAKRCAHLVGALLDYSRYRSNARERVGVGDVIERVLEISAGNARQRSVRIVTRVAKDAGVVSIDRAQIESAIINLVKNAVE